MRTEIKEKIENIARLYERIVLFHEEEGGFGPVFRSVMEKYNGNIVGGEDLKSCAVVVCDCNEIYAEGFRKSLVESGCRAVFVPRDFGLVHSADKMDAIEFNLNVGCSLNCYYCPQGVLLKALKKRGKDARKHHLSFEDFKFIVDERMNPGASLSFSGMSEPFENDDFLKMLLYARENGNKILLNTTLMGATNEVLDEMIGRGVSLEECILHIPDNKGNSHFRVTETYVGILERFLKHYGNCITYMTCHGDAPHEAVRDVIKEAVKRVANEDSGLKNVRYEEKMGARCGNLDDAIRERPPKKSGRLICTVGKSACLVPVCMPDGTLALCCNDYALDTEIGNIFNEEWKDITLGKGVQRYVSALDDESKEYLCRYCGSAMKREDALKYAYPDYLCYGINYYRVRALFAEGKHEVVKRIRNAEHVCIFGLGKFFKDNYFQAGWSEVIRADLLSDNDQSLWGVSMGGIRVIPKEELLAYQNLLVVVYTMTPNVIMEDLRNNGINNIMSISDVMGVLA